MAAFRTTHAIAAAAAAAGRQRKNRYKQWGSIWFIFRLVNTKVFRRHHEVTKRNGNRLLAQNNIVNSETFIIHFCLARVRFIFFGRFFRTDKAIKMVR